MTVNHLKPERLSHRWSSALLWLAISLWLLALILVAGVAAYQFHYTERIYPGDLSLGGLTRAEAEEALAVADIPVPTTPVVVRHEDKMWIVRPDELSVTLDIGATVARAYQVGRGGSWAEDLREQALALRYGRFLDPIFTFHDEGYLAYMVARMAQEVNRPAREATLRLQGLQVLTTPGEDGLEVDQAATRAALEERIRSGGGGEVKLAVRVTHPVLADVSEAEARLKRIIGSPLTLEYEDEREGRLSFTIDRETLASWVRLRLEADEGKRPHLTVTLDEQAVRAWAEGIAAELVRPVRDARFDFDPASGTLTPIVPSQWGRELDVEETVRRILDQAAGEQRTLALPLILTKPAVAMEDAPRMGIRELVVEATTRFKGSSAARVHNIAQAASRFHGVVIPPDGVFSFNKFLGEVSAETGYEESLIIWGDRTQVGIGGGVCQVSTTVFRAALLGGFPILERYAHGYVVSWYGEPGMDATVYAPQVDFKFLNDSGHYLLIETEVDMQAGTLTFRFYGTRTGRTVEIIASPPTNITAPPPPIYEEDPDLPTGVIKQVDWAVKGMDVTVRRIVRQGDEVLFEDTFVSRYRPWAARYRYGPGTTLPPGAQVEGKEKEKEKGESESHSPLSRFDIEHPFVV